MNKKIILLLLLFCLSVPCQGYLFAEEPGDKKDEKPYKVDLDLFHSNDEGDIQPRIAITYKDSIFDGNLIKSKTGYYNFNCSIDSLFTHSWGTDTDNDMSYIDMDFGLVWFLSELEKREHIPAGQLPPSAEGSGYVEVKSTEKYNYGTMKIKGNIRVESDDNGGNFNIAGGIVFIYDSYGAFKKEIPFQLPSLLLAFEYVDTQNENARDALGVGGSSYPRFRGALLWNLYIGEMLFKNRKYAKNTALQMHYRYFKEYDQETPWTDRNYDKYDQYHIKGIYNFPHTEIKKLGLRNMFIGYSSGRQIAHEEDDERIYIGITLQ